METLILALLATPLVFSLVMAFLPKNTSYNVFAGLNLVSVAAVLVLSIMTAGDVLMSGETASALGLWFHLDSLGAIFVLLIGFIGFLTGLFSLPYVKADIEEGSMPAERAKQYFVLFSLFVFTMLLACLSNNMILTWAAVEATTLSTVFLVGIYKNKTALEASWKYAMVCTAGVAFGLFGTLLIYANAADVIPNAHEAAFLSCVLPYADQFDPTLMRLAFAFVVIGFGTKAGLFPMHTWLPDAHSQAPSPVSALLSGVLLKCAMLVIMRFYGFTIQAVGAEYPQLLLLIVGTLSILVAALSMFRQDDLKRRFAYCLWRTWALSPCAWVSVARWVSPQPCCTACSTALPRRLPSACPATSSTPLARVAWPRSKASSRLPPQPPRSPSWRCSALPPSRPLACLFPSS